MPGFITHLCFGQESIKSLKEKKLLSKIDNHPASFGLGLQGPDIFFYYIPAYLTHKKNIGNVMHRNNVNLFFSSLLDVRNTFSSQEDLGICDSFIAGFIGHYTLDTWAHPYIYCRSNHFEAVDLYGNAYDFGNHIALETDIDHIILERFKGLLPSQFDYRKAVLPPSNELSIISFLISEAINKVYPDNYIKSSFVSKSIKTFANLNHAMNDPKGFKKRWLSRVDLLLFKCNTISSMVPSDTTIKFDDPCNCNHSTWTNPWDDNIQHYESIFDIFKLAEKDYLNRLDLLLTSPNSLLSDLGDNSYLSGLSIKKMATLRE